MWVWTRTWNITVSDTSSTVHVNVIFTRTDSNPTLTTWTYNYISTITSTNGINLWNVVTLLWANDWACGNGTGFINATYVYCTNWAGNLNNNELTVVAPSNSEWSSTCSITFTDDEGNTVIWNVLYNYNTRVSWWGGWGWGGWWWGWGWWGSSNIKDKIEDINDLIHEDDNKKSDDQETIKVDNFQKNQNNNTSYNDTTISNNTNTSTYENTNSRFLVWDTRELLSNGFTRELNNAYVFAYLNWITTMDSINKANMNGRLTRIEMAKMLSKYAINVLWKQPNYSKNISFWDVSSSLDSQYNNWVSQAFQLWIMWIWISNFRPFDLVTRAEFATALSRLIYWTPDWATNYYSTHLERLYNNWIISNADPNMHELRWYVMLMLMRTRT